MKLTILNYPENPIDLINEAAAICYAKDPSIEDEDHKYKRVGNCFKMGHLSVFEHVNLTFKIEGISRNCCTQLFRHRHMSVNQESQRYVNYKNIDENDVESWLVIPEKIKEDKQLLRSYKAHAREQLAVYKQMVNDGVKPEDARNLLPGGFKTNCIVTTNLRELFSIFNQRMTKAAQKEIRDLVTDIFNEVAMLNEDYNIIIDWYSTYMMEYEK